MLKNVCFRDAGKYIGIEDVETGEMTLVPLKRIKLRPAVSIAQELDGQEVAPPVKTKQEQVSFPSQLSVLLRY